MRLQQRQKKFLQWNWPAAAEILSMAHQPLGQLLTFQTIQPVIQTEILSHPVISSILWFILLQWKWWYGCWWWCLFFKLVCVWVCVCATLLLNVYYGVATDVGAEEVAQSNHSTGTSKFDMMPVAQLATYQCQLGWAQTKEVFVCCSNWPHFALQCCWPTHIHTYLWSWLLPKIILYSLLSLSPCIWKDGWLLKKFGYYLK